MIYIDNNMFDIYDRLKCLKSDKNQPREAVLFLRSVNHSFFVIITLIKLIITIYERPPDR